MVLHCPRDCSSQPERPRYRRGGTDGTFGGTHGYWLVGSATQPFWLRNTATVGRKRRTPGGSRGLPFYSQGWPGNNPGALAVGFSCSHRNQEFCEGHSLSLQRFTDQSEALLTSRNWFSRGDFGKRDVFRRFGVYDHPDHRVGAFPLNICLVCGR